MWSSTYPRIVIIDPFNYTVCFFSFFVLKGNLFLFYSLLLNLFRKKERKKKESLEIINIEIINKIYIY